MQEIWKDVVGYEGLYQISDIGNVKSVERICYNGRKLKERLLKPNEDRGGYLYVMLYKNSKAKINLVHRLVAIAFLDNDENKREVNHIDLVKTNNCVYNLEWVTGKENKNHYKQSKNYLTRKICNAKLTYEIVEEAKEMYKNGFTQTYIAKKFNVDSSNISRAVRGLSWKKNV